MGPLLLATQYDNEDKPEGSIDPLGTYAISETLASRISSTGVRERQSNLRFLTICSIGWEIISALEPDLKPGDPGSTKELAFEWLVVEALVKAQMRDSSDLRIPGILKAQNALREKLHLNADRYLNTPGTFGFFGVYRTLADYFGIVSLAGGEPVICPEGTRLLEAWRRDQRFPGFGRQRQGEGSKEFKDILTCLRNTYREGQVVDKPGAAFEFVQRYLHPGKVGGPEEARVLREILIVSGKRQEDDHRREVIKAIESDKAVSIFNGDDPGKERLFHRYLAEQSSPTLKSVLRAVKGYENFIELLHDAFDDLRRILTPQPSLVPLNDILSVSKVIHSSSRDCPTAFAEAFKAFDDMRVFEPALVARLDGQFGAFRERFNAGDWLETLITHHERVQKSKPPEGKASWLERDGDKVGVRPLYRLDANPEETKEKGYIYFYRSIPIFNFLNNIRSGSGEN